jgi:hypothetical protein
MAITNAFPNASKLEALKALCPQAGTYKCALLAPGATFDKTSTVYDGTGEVANGNGYVTGGATLTGYSATMNGDTAQLTFTSPTWANSTISAIGALIYDTSNNKIRGVYSFGGTVTSTNGTFTASLPANTVQIA